MDIYELMDIDRIRTIVSRIKLKFFGAEFRIRVSHDVVYTDSDRVFIQILADVPCTKSDKIVEQRGRKEYLSPYMLEDEIIKTVYHAFKTFVEHEVMEAFRFDDKIPFNPHVPVSELIKLSNKEISRS